MNWTVWLGFCGDFLFRWAGDRRWSYLRTAWFDVLLIAITPPFFVPDSVQGARALRVLRVVRAAGLVGVGLRSARRSFGARKFHLVALFAVTTILLGAGAIFIVESGRNRSIESFGDALWWAIVTATTVGYGDVSPVTVEGRLIAVMLMLVGIGVIGVFTATVAGFFIEQEQQDVREVHARLDAIEQKIEWLIRDRQDAER